MRARGRGRRRDESGIVLAIVLVMIFALVTAVYTFQRRAIIDTTIAVNRLEAAEADALARGGLRIAEVLLTVVRARQAGVGGGGGGDDEDDDAPASAPGAGGANVDALWQGIGDLPIRLDDDRELRIDIEDESAKLNLNALVPPSGAASAEGGALIDENDRDEDEAEATSASEQAVEYLVDVIERVIDGMPDGGGERAYDARAIAENILDFIDGDTVAQNGRAEDDYYRRQDPPYTAWNAPLLSVDQLGLVEDVDPPLLDELRHYVTVHPIGSTSGINLNRAEPWVLRLVAHGEGQDYELIDDGFVRDLVGLRNKGKLVCDDGGADPRCVPRGEVGNGRLRNGSIYPDAALPAQPVVFRVVVGARVGEIERRIEAILDTRTRPTPQLLSWRRLRGNE